MIDKSTTGVAIILIIIRPTVITIIILLLRKIYRENDDATFNMRVSRTVSLYSFYYLKQKYTVYIIRLNIGQYTNQVEYDISHKQVAAKEHNLFSECYLFLPFSLLLFLLFAYRSSFPLLLSPFPVLLLFILSSTSTPTP